MNVRSLLRTFNFRVTRGLLWCVLLLLVTGFPAACLQAANPSPKAAAKQSDVLVFLDGSVLHGNLNSIDGATGVRWEHPDAPKPIDFLPRNLHKIKFAHAAISTTNEPPACVLHFQNGDEIFGNLLSLDAQSLTLETWFAGKLTAPRDSIRALTFLSRNLATVYQGPNSLEGWKVGPSPDTWTYQDNSLMTQRVGYMGRNMNLPPISRTEFDLNWTGQLNMVLSLYADVIDQFNFSSTAYMFYLGSGYVNVQRVQGGVGTTHLGQAKVDVLHEKNRAHVEIRVNRDKATLALLVDGNLIDEWKDQAGFVGQGTGMGFYSQRLGALLRVSNLKVSQWDGRYEQSPTAYTNVTETVVSLVNSDQALGKLESIREGQVTLATGPTRLQIPLPRVTEVVMAAATNHANIRPGDVRATFAGGGSVTLKLDTWNPQKLAGMSANFGQINLRPEWVRQLQFNLDQLKAIPDDLDIDADDAFWIQE